MKFKKMMSSLLNKIKNAFSLRVESCFNYNKQDTAGVLKARPRTMVLQAAARTGLSKFYKF